MWQQPITAFSNARQTHATKTHVARSKSRQQQQQQHNNNNNNRHKTFKSKWRKQVTTETKSDRCFNFDFNPTAKQINRIFSCLKPKWIENLIVSLSLFYTYIYPVPTILVLIVVSLSFLVYFSLFQVFSFLFHSPAFIIVVLFESKNTQKILSTI